MIIIRLLIALLLVCGGLSNAIAAPAVLAFPRWQDAKPSAMKMPTFQHSQTDPDTGLAVWRLGGSPTEMHQAQPYPNGAEALSILQAQHFYSRTPPTNRDETYVLSSGSAKQPFAALWRMRDKQLVAWVPSAQETDIQQRQLLWDKNIANVYWYTQGNTLIRAQIDFATYQVQTDVWDTFPEFEFVTFGMGEGNFSDDGSKLVLMGRDNRTDTVYMQPYQVLSKTQLPRRALSKNANWASVDPTGQYIVFDRSTPSEQTLAVPFDQADRAEPWVVYGDLKHSDFVVDKAGEPWLVYGDWRGLLAARVKDGTARKLWPTASDTLDQEPRLTMSGHIARVAGVPGTVLVSRHYDGGLYFANIDRPSVVQYVGNSRQGRGLEGAASKAKAQRFGVTDQGEVTFYKREARGAVSASGRYVFFVSDYQIYATPAGGYEPEPEPCQAYLNMIEVPAKLAMDLAP